MRILVLIAILLLTNGIANHADAQSRKPSEFNYIKTNQCITDGCTIRGDTLKITGTGDSMFSNVTLDLGPIKHTVYVQHGIDVFFCSIRTETKEGQMMLQNLKLWKMLPGFTIEISAIKDINMCLTVSVTMNSIYFNRNENSAMKLSRIGATPPDVATTRIPAVSIGKNTDGSINFVGTEKNVMISIFRDNRTGNPRHVNTCNLDWRYINFIETFVSGFNQLSDGRTILVKDFWCTTEVEYMSSLATKNNDVDASELITINETNRTVDTKHIPATGMYTDGGNYGISFYTDTNGYKNVSAAIDNNGYRTFSCTLTGFPTTLFDAQVKMFRQDGNHRFYAQKNSDGSCRTFRIYRDFNHRYGGWNNAEITTGRTDYYAIAYQTREGFTYNTAWFQGGVGPDITVKFPIKSVEKECRFEGNSDKYKDAVEILKTMNHGNWILFRKNDCWPQLRYRPI